jgi:hypothetical protein
LKLLKGEVKDDFSQLISTAKERRATVFSALALKPL